MQWALGRAQRVWGLLSGVLWVECIQALLSLPHGFSLCSWPCCIRVHGRCQRKGEDRGGPGLDLLRITKAFTKKSSLHAIPIPVSPPPGRFSLNFPKFLRFFHTGPSPRGAVLLSAGQAPGGAGHKAHKVAQMGPTEAPGPRGAGVVALCTGKATAGTPASGSLGNHPSGC